MARFRCDLAVGAGRRRTGVHPKPTRGLKAHLVHMRAARRDLSSIGDTGQSVARSRDTDVRVETHALRHAAPGLYLVRLRVQPGSNCGRDTLPRYRRWCHRVRLTGPAGSMRRGKIMRVVLAQPRGFCAGVERAIEIVERALEKYGPPIYVRHEIVHNRHVVERLRAKGAHFVDELDEIPPRQRHHLQRPWRRQRGRGARRRARAAGDRRDLPARLQGAYRGPALRQAGPRDHPDRPCRPSRNRGHDGPDQRPGASDLDRGGGRAAARSPTPTSSPSSPRRRSASTTRAPSSRR